jgi:hypothetical protein
MRKIKGLLAILLIFLSINMYSQTLGQDNISSVKLILQNEQTKYSDMKYSYHKDNNYIYVEYNEGFATNYYFDDNGILVMTRYFYSAEKYDAVMENLKKTFRFVSYSKDGKIAFYLTYDNLVIAGVAINSEKNYFTISLILNDETD